MPDTLTGTVLSSEEFRDSLRLRYGRRPTALPTRCDGCSKNFSVEHALSCKVDGLVPSVTTMWQGNVTGSVLKH